MNMLIEADKKNLEDAKRAAEIAEEIAGPLAASLPICIGLMNAVFGFTHGKDAMDDFANCLARFTAVFPIVDETADDEDLQWLVSAANQINQAWATARPPIATRAIQILVWSGAVHGLAEAYGDDAVEAFVKMVKGWAAAWDSNN